MIAPLLSKGLQAWLHQRRERTHQHGAEDSPELLLECIGIDVATRQQLQAQLPALGHALAASLRLAQHQGDLVLVDAAGLPEASRIVILAMCEGRPSLNLRRRAGAADGEGGGVDLDDLLRQMHQLREDAERATRAPAIGPGVAPQSSHGKAFLEAVYRARTDPDRMPLRAVYPDGGVLILDFASARASADADAWLDLRAHARLPSLDPLAKPRGELVDEELDRVLWMLGMAGAHVPLLDAPDNERNTALVPVHLNSLGRYSLQPLHRDMARVVSGGGVTPAQLRQRCRVADHELLAFLQACLLLSLLAWRPARLPAWADDNVEPDANAEADGACLNPPAASA